MTIRTAVFTPPSGLNGQLDNPFLIRSQNSKYVISTSICRVVRILARYKGYLKVRLYVLVKVRSQII